MSRQSSPAAQPPLAPDEQSRGVMSTLPSPAAPPEPVTSPIEPPEPVTSPVEPPELTLCTLDAVALVTLMLALPEPPALVASVLLVRPSELVEPPLLTAAGSPFCSDLPQARRANPASTAPNRSPTRRQ